jgi:hypothetical protein
MKFSKDLLELRDKEAKLVKMKRYEEAEKVKMKADLLEEFERNKLEAEVFTFTISNIIIDASRDWEEGSKTPSFIIISIGCSVKENPERQEWIVKA